MRKLYFFICILASLCILVSCSGTAEIPDYANAVVALEQRLEELKNEQSSSDADNRKAISELSALVNSLVNQNHDNSQQKPSGSSQGNTASQPLNGFTYTISDGYATVTGYSGDETELVIPSSIDGNRVIAIADGAFEGKPLTDVIISDKIQKIGWFAFNGCQKLTSITVPSSVTDIGYLAFGSAGSPLTVYCHDSSFALSYAKSYGLSYTII